MNLRVSLLLRSVLPVFCVAGMVSRGAAQETDMGALLGLSSTRMLEIEERFKAAESSGEWQQGMTQLASLAQTAQKDGDRAAQIAAELAWVKLASHENEPDQLEDALQVMVTHARDWNMARQEAEVFTYWAELREDQGEWLSAMRAYDSAAQATLGAGMVSRAMRALLEMSRLCRDNDHPWRLQQVWVRIGQVEQEFSLQLDVDTRAALEKERALILPRVAGLVPLVPAVPKVDLQPAAAVVKVSAPHGEVGRARFFLTNESLRTVDGTLHATAKTGTVKKWDSGENGQWLTLGPAENDKVKEKPVVSGERPLSLRPGERLSVYVEREMPAAQDTLNLKWSGKSGNAEAVGEFVFVKGEPLSSITNSGSFEVRPGWGVPFYHEINHRGAGVRVEDFQFQASVPCRLEIFDVDGGRHPSVDAGTLLAVDAEGDGIFTGPADILNSDLNEDTAPDMLIADRSRSLEVFAWPLVPLPQGESVTLTARLRRPEEPDRWRTDAENSLTLAPAQETKTVVKRTEERTGR